MVERKEINEQNILEALDMNVLSSREILNRLGYNWEIDGKEMGEVAQIISKLEDSFGQELKVAIDRKLKRINENAAYHPFSIKYYRADQERMLIHNKKLSSDTTRIQTGIDLKDLLEGYL